MGVDDLIPSLRVSHPRVMHETPIAVRPHALLVDGHSSLMAVLTGSEAATPGEMYHRFLAPVRRWLGLQRDPSMPQTVVIVMDKAALVPKEKEAEQKKRRVREEADVAKARDAGLYTDFSQTRELDFEHIPDRIYPVSIRTQPHAKTALIRYFYNRLVGGPVLEDDVRLVVDFYADRPAAYRRGSSLVNEIPASTKGEGEMAICDWTARLPAAFYGAPDVQSSTVQVMWRTDDADVVAAGFKYAARGDLDRCAVTWAVYSNPAVRPLWCDLSSLYAELLRMGVTPVRLAVLCACMGCDYASKSDFTRGIGGPTVWVNGLEACAQRAWAAKTETLDDARDYLVASIKARGRRSMPNAKRRKPAGGGGDQDDGKDDEFVSFAASANIAPIPAKAKKRTVTTAEAVDAFDFKPRTQAQAADLPLAPRVHLSPQAIEAVRFLVGYWAS